LITTGASEGAVLGDTREVGEAGAFDGVATTTGGLVAAGDSAAGELETSVEGLGSVETGTRPQADPARTLAVTAATRILNLIRFAPMVSRPSNC
jgi:hypothetical protein